MLAFEHRELRIIIENYLKGGNTSKFSLLAQSKPDNAQQILEQSRVSLATFYYLECARAILRG